MKHLFKSIFATGAILGAVLCTEAGQDLPINGDFRGAPSRHHVAPGWSCSPGGSARLLPRRHGKQMLELFAAPNAPKIAVSDLHQVGPGLLELKADVSGTGVVALGFEAFDATRQTVVQSDRRQWQLTNVKSKIHFNFPLNAAGIAYVRVTLVAEAGSVARFSDVDADMHYAPAPAPVAPQPPPPAPVPVAPQAQVLMHDGFYALESLPPVAVFQTSVYAGKDIDFKLGEHHGQWWSVAPGYDPRICRVEIEHKHKHGMSYMKVELNGMYRGTTNVEFVNPAGKRVIVQFSSL